MGKNECEFVVDGDLSQQCSLCLQIKPVGDFDEGDRHGRKSPRKKKCRECDAKFTDEYLAAGASYRTKKRKPLPDGYWKSVKVRFYHGRRNAESRGMQWLLTMGEFASLCRKPCHYCGKSFESKGSGLDRFKEDRVYRPETVVPCCGRCNKTFMDQYSYEEKLILAESIRRIDALREQGRSISERSQTV